MFTLGITKVSISFQQNCWVSPFPIIESSYSYLNAEFAYVLIEWQPTILNFRSIFQHVHDLLLPSLTCWKYTNYFTINTVVKMVAVFAQELQLKCLLILAMNIV